MVSDQQLAAKLGALNARVSSIAREYGLDAFAGLFQPRDSDIFAGEPSIEVIVFKRTSGAPLQTGKSVTVSRYEQMGDSIFEQFIRDEAAPKLNAPK